VNVTATAGGRLRLLSPWRGITVHRGDGEPAELKPDARGIVELDTRSGEQMVFRPKDIPASPADYSALSRIAASPGPGKR